MNRSKEIFYPESRFGGFTDVDGTVAFFSRVRALAEPDAVVLDIGCGRGACADEPRRLLREVQNFRGSVQKVIGIDVDPVAAENPTIDEFRMIDGPRWPVEDASIDVAVSSFVMEHVENPAEFLSECYRVLKPGGYLCMRTSNRLGYVGVIASLIPNSLHARVLGKAQEQRRSEDVFPTTYRCNTVPALRRALSRHKFDHYVYGFESEPNYLNFSRLAYGLGVLYQRLAPNFLRGTIFAFARKPDGTGSGR